MNPESLPSPTKKRNVSEFNADVRANGGYLYTTNARLSSIVANRRITEAILDAIPPGPATLIDIGCGDGTYTHALKEARPDLACTGFDPAEAAIEAARKRFPDVEYVVGDMLDPATFPTRRFDIGVVRGVIHHLPDAAAGIEKAARMAHRIILVEPNGDNPILKWVERASTYHREHEEQSYPLKRLLGWCGADGLKVTSVRHIGFIPFLFPSLPTRIIRFLQPGLERIGPLVRRFGAQIVIAYGKVPEKPGPGGA